MTETQLINGIAAAIATMEGYHLTEDQARAKKLAYPSVARRNNNPGNLRSWGANPVKNGYAVFPNPDEGWAALRAQIAKNIGRKLTLEEFFAGKPGVYGGYAPAEDSNHPKQYAAFVGRSIGVPVEVPLNSLVQTPTKDPTKESIPMKQRSWKTTIAGILAIAGAVGAVVQNPAKMMDVQTLGTVAGGVGLILAKDHKNE